MYKRYMATLLLSLGLLTAAAASATTTPSISSTDNAEVSAQTTADGLPAPLSEDQKYQKWAGELWDSIDRKSGEVKLADDVATLNVPETFYFLNTADAEKVLVNVWGNPPGQQVLGMLMPSQLTPFDAESWAVTISYEEDGYVTDEDADEINYDDLLSQMQQDTADASVERVKQGYEPISLVGWAATPYYDAKSHKLHWAKELQVGDLTQHTLNYNIRMLGRKGVLVLNFIAGMDQKDQVQASLPEVLAMADFDEGSKYSDFDPYLDDVAAYGIGALIAGKVIAKTGLIAIGFVFLKKFGIFIVVGMGVFLRKLFAERKQKLGQDAPTDV
ncbi:MAG: putative membrane-anchored protein [Alteromonadaceae bacterium]|jgi:uncharacterized membrane-anchored protein